MVESFPGRNSQQIRPFLPPYQGGGSLSRSVFFHCLPVVAIIPIERFPLHLLMPMSNAHPRKGMRCRLGIGFCHCQYYGLIRKPNLICEQNTIDHRSFGQ
ncbi:conserved hypothetical protein [Dickeya parazeae Ech586]|uniref:Uncharacterized protein n=1 Tax=Dickeya zeae (strain Ech586) TaxID=590409 RepID=D2BX36_DICZ5|nr:conserved hypothetical protein [Dickeya parazeae Ech586]